MDFPILEEFRAQGLTDYLAVPAQGRVGHRMAVTWATDRPGGFSEEDIARIGAILPVLSLVLEIQSQEAIARTLLDTYIGRHTGTRVLDGSIRRGSGETIHAALWLCDLRGSTEMAERLPREAMLETLNAFFGTVVDRVHAHGGEVLKFLGDGLLAIFRPDIVGEALCVCRAVDAANEAFGAIETLNAARSETSLPALRFGLGLHLGDVVYGNIGAPDRLDFTVTGPAVNLVARLEDLTKTVNRPMLMSSEFARLCPRPTQSLGLHVLRGVSEPHEVFALA
jgi:adenylate cyclase